jgi:hypothetical protein
VFYSTEQQITLTFKSSPPQMTDCNLQKLIVSEQGYAICASNYYEMATKGWKTDSRNRRELATTEEIASELTREEQMQMQTLEKISSVVCNTTKPMERNPTKLARLMLSRENVMAKWRTSKLLEVFQCEGIERSGISIRQSNECTLYLPVWVNHTEIGMISAFLDPMLSIFTKTSPVADCRLHDRHYVNDGDK